MDVAVGRSEGCLREKTRRVFWAHQQSRRSSIHLCDQISRGSWTRARIQDLQIEIAGLSWVDGGCELHSAVEHSWHRGAVLQNLRSIDEVAACKNDGGRSDVERHRGSRHEYGNWVIHDDVLADRDRGVVYADCGQLK